MRKKAIILIMAVSMMFACVSVAQARASEYISNYTIYAEAGDNPGEIDIIFGVQGTPGVTKLGATSIKIYKSNGVHVTTIWGSTSNGLMATAGNRYFENTYTFVGEPGTSYYALVTCYAGNASGSDTRQGMTPTIKAPY